MKISKIDGLPHEIKNEDYLHFVRNERCLICGFYPEVHHIQSRKRGRLDTPVFRDGEYVRGGVVPLCSGHHTDINHGVHGIGKKSFEKLHDIDLADEAVKIFQRYEAVK